MTKPLTIKLVSGGQSGVDRAALDAGLRGEVAPVGGREVQTGRDAAPQPETGLLEMPNVDLVQEMTDLTSANRSYQANVTVLNAVKQMALRALDITSR